MFVKLQSIDTNSLCLITSIKPSNPDKLELIKKQRLANINTTLKLKNTIFFHKPISTKTSLDQYPDGKNTISTHNDDFECNLVENLKLDDGFRVVEDLVDTCSMKCPNQKERDIIIEFKSDPSGIWTKRKNNEIPSERDEFRCDSVEESTSSDGRRVVEKSTAKCSTNARIKFKSDPVRSGTSTGIWTKRKNNVIQSDKEEFRCILVEEFTSSDGLRVVKESTEKCSSKNVKQTGVVRIEIKSDQIRSGTNTGVWTKRKNNAKGGTITLYKNGNGAVGTENGNFLNKFVRYGGCIPAILESLERIIDLDEALRPWEGRLTKKEMSIVLKEQLNWERALDIFQWFKRKGCYEVNVIHYNIILRTLGKARRWDLIEKLWDEMKERNVMPVNSTFGTLIDVYSKGILHKEAVCWLDLMREQNMEPDEVTMGIVVQMYKKAREFEKAEQFFKKWTSNRKGLSNEDISNAKRASSRINGDVDCNHLSAYTYNTIIDTFGKAGQLKEAYETFEKMLKEGITPTTVTFNTLIHMHGCHGRVGEVKELIQKMEKLRCQPDNRTYNILIFIYAKHHDIEMAERYFTKMKEGSLEPDLVSYRTLLYAFSVRQMVVTAEKLILEMDEKGLLIDGLTQSALTRMYIEAGMIAKSCKWFTRFHLEGKMSSESYAANIDAFGVRGLILEAEKIFMSCLEGRRPDVLEFNVMIKAYGISKMYDKACDLFDSMNTYNVVPDKCSYSSLIQILAGANLPYLAIVYVRKMQKAGLISDCIGYCSVMTSFAKSGKLEKAEEIFTEMVGYNVLPDVVVYGVMINAFADNGSVEKASIYVKSMAKACIPVNSVICNSLIKLYTKVGNLTKAEKIYEKLKSSNSGPLAYCSNCMIDLYSRRCMVKQAEDIFDNLRRKGDANEFSYAMILCMYKKLGRYQEAISIARKMRELGLLTVLLSYNQVLDVYALSGRFKEAYRMFEEMMKLDIQPDESTFKSLGAVLVKCGISKEAVDELENTRRKDPERGLQIWFSTLTCVVCVEYDENL